MQDKLKELFESKQEQKHIEEISEECLNCYDSLTEISVNENGVKIDYYSKNLTDEAIKSIAAIQVSINKFMTVPEYKEKIEEAIKIKTEEEYYYLGENNVS